MKIPLLNIYVLTAKSLRKKEEDIAITTRRMTDKIVEGLLYDNILLKEEVAELKRERKWLDGRKK